MFGAPRDDPEFGHRFLLDEAPERGSELAVTSSVGDGTRILASRSGMTHARG